MNNETLPTYKNLKELTHHKDGIVVYGDGQVIVCDWAEVCPNGGLPIRLKIEEIGSSMNDEFDACIEVMKQGEVGDINTELPKPMIRDKIYDPHDCLLKLCSSNNPRRCYVYDVKCHSLTAKVLTLH
jgi:hypothetical protein